MYQEFSKGGSLTAERIAGRNFLAGMRDPVFAKIFGGYFDKIPHDNNPVVKKMEGEIKSATHHWTTIQANWPARFSEGVKREGAAGVHTVWVEIKKKIAELAFIASIPQDEFDKMNQAIDEAKETEGKAAVAYWDYWRGVYSDTLDLFDADYTMSEYETGDATAARFSSLGHSWDTIQAAFGLFSSRDDDETRFINRTHYLKPNEAIEVLSE